MKENKDTYRFGLSNHLQCLCSPHQSEKNSAVLRYQKRNSVRDNALLFSNLYNLTCARSISSHIITMCWNSARRLSITRLPEKNIPKVRLTVQESLISVSLVLLSI